MPSSCCAVNCTNRQVPGTDKKFFRIPKLDQVKRNKWINAIRRANWVPNDGTRICSDHFILGKCKIFTICLDNLVCLYII